MNNLKASAQKNSLPTTVPKVILLKHKKVPLIIVLVILLGVSGFYMPFYAANDTLSIRQHNEDNNFQDISIKSLTTDDERTPPDGTQKITNSPENPDIDPIGKGAPILVEEYLVNTTVHNNINVHGLDSTLNFHSVSPASLTQDIPLAYGNFAFYNIRNETVSTNEIEEYTLHSSGFSTLYAQGFNVTSEFEYYYLNQFTIGKVVFYGGGGSFTVEVRNSTEDNHPSDEVFFSDTYAHGALGEVTDITFVINNSLLLKANRTYFVVFSTNNCDWYYVGDGSLGDMTDDGIACHHDGNTWIVSQPAIPGGETIDFALQKIGYQTAFYAESVGLEINGTQVENKLFGNSVGGEVVVIHDPPLHPNGTGYFNYDLTIDPTFNVTMDVNCTLRYLWDTKQTDILVYSVLNRTSVNWNASFDAVIPANSDLSRGDMSWYNYSFILKDQNTDWNGTRAYDSDSTDLTNLCEFVNGSYVYVTSAAVVAATSPDGLWIVQYESPNYLTQLNISPVASLYNSSDTLTVSATLIGNNINSGTASLNFTNPSGETMYTQTDAVPNGGVVDFDPFEISGDISDGKYTILVLFEGNSDTLNEIGFLCQNITIDGLEAPPVTTISPDDTTIQSTTPITLNADDGMGVGVDYIQYRIDGGAWVNYTVPFDFSAYGEGTYPVEFNSTDLNGNREQTKNMTYVVDDTPPETTIEPVDLAITSSTLINLTAVDIGGSDIDVIGYRIDGGAWLVYTRSFTLDAGNHFVEYNATDRSGNVESTKSKDYVVDDTTPPVTAITPAVSTIRTDIMIVLTATDGGSGVNQTEYRIDENEWQNYTGPFTLTVGTHLVEYNSKDNAGNIELVKSKVYIVDDTPPVTTATPDNATIITTSTLIILSADDLGGAGVNSIAYRVDGGAWKSYSMPFTISYGIHVLQYNSTDQSGNVEITNELTYTVNDLIAPTTVISPLDETITSNNQIQLTATDDVSGSGVLETWYRIDQGAWTLYTTPFTLIVGNYSIEFYSVDVVLNTEPITQFNYTVDDMPPNTTITPELQYIQPFTSISLETNDTGGSGVSEIYYRIDGGGFSQVWVLYDSPFVLDPGFHEVEYYAVDFSGNTEVIHLTNYTIDGAAPVSSVNVSTSLINTTTVIEITSNDAIAGVNYIAYKLNDGDWWLYAGPFSLYEGDYTLYYNATDLAGNEEWTKSISFTVEDIAPPTTEITPSNDTIVENTYIYLWAEDDWTGSGVSMILYSINAGSWTVYEGGFVLTENGTYTISYFAMDNAGNNEIVDYKVYEVVEEIVIDEDDGGGSGGSGGSGDGGGKNTSYIEVSTSEKDYSPEETVVITGKLNGGGNYESDKLIFIEFNGDVFNTTTKEGGVFSFELTAPETYGNYSAMAIFEGDSNWKPSSCVCNVLIVEQDSVLTMNINGAIEENNTITINLNLKTEDGKGIPNEELLVIIYAQAETSVEIQLLNEDNSYILSEASWDVIFEGFTVTDERGNAQLLFIVPTSQKIKIEAIYTGCIDTEMGYIGASEAIFIEGQPKTMELGVFTTTSDILMRIIGVITLIGVCIGFTVAWKVGAFFKLRHHDIIAFVNNLKQLVGKRKKISLEEVSLNIDLSIEEVKDNLSNAVSLGLIYGLLDLETNEFIFISVIDEFQLKERLKGVLKHHKGYFNIDEFAKRFDMSRDQLLWWLEFLYDTGEIGRVVQSKSKKDQNRYRYIPSIKLR